MLRNPILSTVPEKFCILTRSPGEKGLSKKIIKEAIKFSRLSLADKAKAAPTIPKPASNATIFY